MVKARGRGGAGTVEKARCWGVGWRAAVRTKPSPHGFPLEPERTGVNVRTFDSECQARVPKNDGYIELPLQQIPDGLRQEGLSETHPWSSRWGD